MIELKTQQELVNEWIRRFLAYTDEVTWFGGTSIMRAIARATAGLASGAFRTYVALLRRVTLMGASGDTLVEVAAEHGVEAKGATRAKVLVIVVPWSEAVVAIRAVSSDDYIEVADSSAFEAGDSIRIRSADGATTETATIASISAGTGLVDGGDEFVITGGLSSSYSPGSEDVTLLLRYDLAKDVEISSSAGMSFTTVEPVTVGDANPVLAGEGTALSLADKVWCEATEAGSAGNIEALTVTGFTTPIADLVTVYNPEAATGGADTETEYELKYRTAHYAALQNQETQAWVEALAQASAYDVLRAVRSPDLVVGTINILVLKRNGGIFGPEELAGIGAYIGARVRSYMDVSVDNVTLTSVECEYTITLQAGYTLEAVWRAAASRLADFLDWRKWAFGGDVDEADLLSIVNNTPGVATLETATAVPSSDVSVASTSLPSLVRLSLQDSTTGDTINATLAQSF